MKPIYTLPESKGYRVFLLLAIALLLGYIVIFGMTITKASWSHYGANLVINAAWLAGFCAVISTILGYILAYMIFMTDFTFRSFLIQMLRLLMILPIMLGIVGIINIYGSRGIITQFVDLKLIYNSTGVALGFCLFNIPYACVTFLLILQNIPQNRWLVAIQLGMRGFSLFRHVIWVDIVSSLKNLLLIIFFLCFTSFEIVLILGGGKVKNLTTELYTAISIGDFNLVYDLGLMQILIGLALLKLLSITTMQYSYKHGFLLAPDVIPKPPYALRISIITIMTIILFSPMISILIKGLRLDMLMIFKQPQFYHALWDSIWISLWTAGFTMIAILLLAIYRRFYFIFFSMGMVFPSYFLLSALMIIAFNLRLDFFAYGPYLAICLITLSTIPLVAQMILPSLITSINSQRYLSMHLAINTASWLYHIIWLKTWRLLLAGFLISFALTLGTYSILAFLSDGSFKPLMALLADYMGKYRFDLADQLALIILIIYIALFAAFSFLNHAEKENHHAED